MKSLIPYSMWDLGFGGKGGDSGQLPGHEYKVNWDYDEKADELWELVYIPQHGMGPLDWCVGFYNGEEEVLRLDMMWYIHHRKWNPMYWINDWLNQLRYRTAIKLVDRNLIRYENNEKYQKNISMGWLSGSMLFEIIT